MLKQECRADFLDCSNRELRRQIHCSRMEVDHSNLGYKTSRREQARLHEKLAQRERALRETHIKGVHEVEETKRAQEMRIDEFSRHELRERLLSKRSHLEYKSLQERVNFMNDSREFQYVESVCSATKACDLMHGTCLVHGETFLAVPLHQSIHHRHLYRGTLHPWNLNATCGNLVRDSTGRLVARSEEQNRDTIPTPRFVRRPSTRNSFFPAEGSHPQNDTAHQQRLQILELHLYKIPTPSTFFTLEDRIQNPRKCLFWFSLGGNVMDQRSGDDRLSGPSKTIALNSREYSFPEF